MSNISKEVRVRLAERYRIFRPELAEAQQSSDGSRKYLFRMDDGSMVESVLICQPTRYTLCVSSQVGCAIGCRFCRTGLMGLTRHLRTAEIVGQVLAVQDDIAQRRAEGDLTAPENGFQNIVFMGMGEPLHNFDNVVRAVKLLNDELGFNFSSRKITVSTSGLVPAIQRFGASGAGANLAVSLNATTDEVRDEVIPINKKWPIAELLAALREYPLKSRKRITIEYVMLRGINDRDEDLERLPQLLRGIPVKINLIPYNSNTGLGFFPPERSTIGKWQDTLLGKGLNATIRWSKGQDISAACGQLATESARRKSSRRVVETTENPAL
jgi:23S rRNA (adenine2503-C2)-methyltransferase